MPRWLVRRRSATSLRHTRTRGSYGLRIAVSQAKSGRTYTRLAGTPGPRCARTGWTHWLKAAVCGSSQGVGDCERQHPTARRWAVGCLAGLACLACAWMRDEVRQCTESGSSVQMARRFWPEATPAGDSSARQELWTGMRLSIAPARHGGRSGADLTDGGLDNGQDSARPAGHLLSGERQACAVAGAASQPPGVIGVAP